MADDVKEYWGFYLLKGSHVRLSVCSRHEGAYFIVVKSLKDARRCAFLGELDSEEESDENSDSDEFEFVKDGKPPPKSELESEVFPTESVPDDASSPTISASREMMHNFMSKFVIFQLSINV